LPTGIKGGEQCVLEFVDTRGPIEQEHYNEWPRLASGELSPSGHHAREGDVIAQAAYDNYTGNTSRKGFDAVLQVLPADLLLQHDIMKWYKHCKLPKGQW
jgi:hypothetical protein